MSSLYADLPLLQPDKQIRLLRLEQSSSDCDDYNFSLAVHDFHDDARPSYIAISYTWGDAVPLLSIIVNGNKIRVQFNCWYALWQMRHHGFTDYLWIDSLCINQDNDEEKNFQVAIMGSIYECALWVASCLGTGETIGAIQSALASNDNEALIARVKLRERFDQIPYFDRIWIKQEIILAHAITIFYGVEKISWEDFTLLINAGEDPGDKENVDYDPLEDSNHFQVSSNSSAESRDLDLQVDKAGNNSGTIQLCSHRLQPEFSKNTFMDLVLRYDKAKATNPRDKIYALLSLLPKDDFIRQNLPIEYDQRPFQVFHKIVRLLYSTYGDEEVGRKNLTLTLVRKWLGIDENDQDMAMYLTSIPSSPSDWLPSSTSDLISPWLKGMDPFAIVYIDEMYPLLGKDNIQPGPRFSIEPMGHSPVALLQNITSWRPDESKQGKTETNLSIPSRLKTIKVISQLTRFGAYNWREFLVNPDVKPGDFIARVVWDGESTLLWSEGYIILRKMKTMNGDEETDELDHSVPCLVNKRNENDTTHLLQRGSNETISYFLHSWVVLVDTSLTLLHSGNPFIDLFSERRKKSEHLGQLELHHRDALIPLILDQSPLHALMYPAPEGTSLSTIQLDNTLKSGNRKRQLSCLSKHEADYDYIRDVLG
ncbi:hypothetical protein SBOR_7570 [Sclerotinia borealis F-4128]|uniref:Heterokaryon incompatibility domain-containing protein n=1 Tax=Sclerotinia borealis (strain F-4128) TaxID=1432307 RepID=W9CBU3_SCLBF|nr:hypothetical protein SBOR_7570 [Sclerotinia borealis F-4128]